MLNILLVIYGETYLDDSIEKLIDISARLFPREKIRIVVADTSRPPSIEVKKYRDYAYIMPGNVNREFTGWKGCFEYIDSTYTLTDDDVFIISNDTFFRNYGDKYLEDFQLIDVNRAKQEKQIIGYVDCYPSEVEVGDTSFRCWIRTSFFITGYNVLKDNPIFEPPFKKEDVFDGQVFFQDGGILSARYKKYIKSWLFNDEEAPEEFPYKWHSAKSVKESDISNIIDKAYCIINEHYITWMLRSNGVSIIRVNPAPRQSDIDLIPLKLKTQTLLNLGRDNCAITNKNISRYLFSEAYWYGSSICSPKIKMAWLSQQDWYSVIFPHSEDAPSFETANIFLEIRKDLQKNRNTEAGHSYKRYLYELYLGDVNSEYYPDKFEIEWLNSVAAEKYSPDIGYTKLPWIFSLLYEYEFKESWSKVPGKDEFFLGYLFFTSHRWANKAGLETFYEWIVNDRRKLEASIKLYAKNVYQIELADINDIGVVYSEELYVERIDKTLLSLLRKDEFQDIYSLNDYKQIGIQLHVQCLHKNRAADFDWGQSVIDYKDVLTDGGKILLQKLYYPFLQEYMGLSTVSYDALYINNDNSILDNKIKKTALDKDGISVIGFARSEMGTGEDTRRTYEMIHSLGYDVSIYPLYPSDTIYNNEQNEFSDHESKKLGLIQIYTMPPAEYMETYCTGNINNSNAYKIGYFAWEFSTWKDDFDVIYDLIDEIWVISKFLLPSFRNSKIPVKYMPPIVELVGERPRDKNILDKLGIPKENYLFLSVFDIKSTIERKNPMALIDGFLSEYSNSDNVKLVLKFSYDENDKQNNTELFDLIAKSNNIIHISEMLSKPELEALIYECDAFVSLHRAEGFGRVIAEAMLLKTLVICTNYSGNKDFCNKQNSILVDFDIVQVGEQDYPFALNLQWAKVKKDSVVKCLRQAVNDTHDNQLRIENAYHYIKAHHSLNSVRFYAKNMISNAVKLATDKYISF